MKPIPRWLEVVMVSAFVMIVIHDYTQRQRFPPLVLPLLLIVFYILSWITDKRFTVKKPYPRLRLLLRTVSLSLGLLAVFGYMSLLNGGQVMMSLLLILSLLGAVGTAIAGFFASQMR